MGKAGRRKRRQAESQGRRDEIRRGDLREREQARRAARAATKQDLAWFQRQGGGVQTLVVLGSIAAAVGGHFLLWGAVFPALGAAVGRVPVVSTVTGWLFGGGAFLAWGVVAVNHKTATPRTTARLRTVAWVWSAVAVLLVPTGYANDVLLPVDFWAGVYAGAYGMLLSPVALGVVALGWWLLVTKLFKHKGEPSTETIGWICVGYSVLLLVWGSTLLRA
ncbi:hypothetical protein [Saccharothrix hoggarensis]|uniref:Yip1-like protein n=1 Tax=Saccharothrix hoggarensis TaxID=913853 RepID=A0ABW3QY21_9PSEU